MDHYQFISLALILFPLGGALIAGLGGQRVSASTAHRVTIFAVALSFLLSLYFAYELFFLHGVIYDENLYLWDFTGKFRFNIGFLIDPLTVVMFLIVTFISFIVHIYSVTYMAGDPGYKRFFSYMSAFTFAMLMLVSANNFLQLFFGWEAVGLVSYLLIGFWFKREAANRGSFKAFLVNRIGDFGFFLGIALLFNYFGSLDYYHIFHTAAALKEAHLTLFPHTSYSVIAVICFLLFIGAMGKSAQIPLHVWLPESMEGPTPISALIHAATMVTAGVYLVARLSPLYEYAPGVLNLILILGGTTALSMGLVAIVQNDIKRIVAYSTLSQLGYMVVGLGASAYAASIFHLVTHAFFKALLFLAAGSVILTMHHEQDIRKMGGLAKIMPITMICFLIGALALAAIPPFSGFYSKDVIIDAVHESTLPAATYAYYCVLFGAFVTSFYIFRAFFLVFQGRARAPHPRYQQTTSIVRFSLIALAIPSTIAGFLFAPAFLNVPGLLTKSFTVLSLNNTMVNEKGLLINTATLFSILGIGLAWLCYRKFPTIPAWAKNHFTVLYRVLVNKYGFDSFNQLVFEKGGRRLAQLFFNVDMNVLDEKLIDGSGRRISWLSQLLRHLQSGYIYHYALMMVFGIIVFLLAYSL
ncbi:NADH-quinone oxidoreductase subunit L [Rickettsiella grylli]|uniref:NADH-quinone oxidoreductase chain l (Nadh dehydrogenasei, chain l) (Ndh-1, chain l) n=1 Tax=Rickettsiella grylli TaxID=59196 RepID=A8PM95_9COXI|nr:NADH-quinone oxidoreductase subunit L [Rickettsiella grylli]EDP46564.1 NADH-quinone oxidoreductase chain l (nadh dehydrogenasei, chain l) (ndh-1, chain l) [Rickettsiella grylli]